MKNLTTPLNLLSVLFFGLFCYITGVFLSSGDNLAMHLSIWFLLFTLILVIFKQVAVSIKKEYDDARKCYESQIKSLQRQVLKELEDLGL
tara:strand:- start:365 stop:634 length:270 start_codon:yes stop_codon:yes gene_type:complete